MSVPTFVEFDLSFMRMSPSLRTALRKAAYALDQFFDVLEERPEARSEVLATVGEEGIRELEEMRSSLKRFSERVERDHRPNADG